MLYRLELVVTHIGVKSEEKAEKFLTIQMSRSMFEVVKEYVKESGFDQLDLGIMIGNAGPNPDKIMECMKMAFFSGVFAGRKGYIKKWEYQTKKQIGEVKKKIESEAMKHMGIGAPRPPDYMG